MDKGIKWTDVVGAIGAIVAIVGYFFGSPAGWPDGVKYTMLGIGVAAVIFALLWRLLKPTKLPDQTPTPSSSGISAEGDIKNESGAIIGGPNSGNINSPNSGNHTINNNRGGIGSIGTVKVSGKASFGGDFHDDSTTTNVQGGIHNYGKVSGDVNSGSGNQTNIRAGNISGNQGNVAVGSGVSQSYSAGGQASSSAASLLTTLEDLRDQIDDRLAGNDSQRMSVRTPLTTAIKSLRNGQIDASTVSTTLQQAANALTNLNMTNERNTLKSAARAVGLNIA